MKYVDLDEHIAYLSRVKTLAPDTLRNYKNAIHYLQVPGVLIDNMSPVWQHLNVKLADKESRNYGWCYHMRDLLKGLLRIHGVLPTGPEYYEFNNTINKMKHSPDAYTDEQLRLLLEITRFQDNNNIHRLLIFLIYTGARLSSAKGIKFSDFMEVGVPGVLTVRVVGKGTLKGAKNYNAFISQKAFDYMQECKAEDDGELIVPFNPVLKSDFGHYARAKLIREVKSIRSEYWMNNHF
jgi:integrase